MAYQSEFWKRSGRDGIRPNPEAPPMRGGPGPSDEEDMASTVNRGTSQPSSKGHGSQSGELPLKHANVHPRRRQVLMAHALRTHGEGTTMGTAVGGGAAGGGAG